MITLVHVGFRLDTAMVIRGRKIIDRAADEGVPYSP